MHGESEPEVKVVVNYKNQYAAMGFEISPAKEKVMNKSLGHALTICERGSL